MCLCCVADRVSESKTNDENSKIKEARPARRTDGQAAVPSGRPASQIALLARAFELVCTVYESEQRLWRNPSSSILHCSIFAAENLILSPLMPIQGTEVDAEMNTPTII